MNCSGICFFLVMNPDPNYRILKGVWLMFSPFISIGSTLKGRSKFFSFRVDPFLGG